MFGRAKVAALVAEFLGTFVLSSAVLTMLVRTEFPFFPALVAGLVLLTTVLVFGPISGAHINPAVTIALWARRKVETTEMIVYIAAQLLGGLVAFRFGQWLLSENLTGNVLPRLFEMQVDWNVLVAEAIGAMIFTIGVAAAVRRAYAGATYALTVGLSFTLGILVASLGGSGIVNPAVALAVNSFSVSYIVGPIAGGILGTLLYFMLLDPETSRSTKKRK